MKKKITAVLLSMCLVLSMTACGGANKTIETYFETEEGQAMVEAAQNSVGEGMDIKMYAEANDLIYEYTFEDGSLDDATVEVLSTELVSALESEAATFEDIAVEMNELVKADNCRVIVRYYYAGELLAESTFTAAE